MLCQIQWNHLTILKLANKNDAIIPTTRPGYKLIEKAQNVLPIVWPPLTVKFKEALSSEEQESLKVRGAAIIAAKKASDIAYTFSGDSVDHELLGIVYRHRKKAQSTCPTPVGSINLRAYQDLFRALGIVTWFLRTQTYPAFSGDINEDSDEGGFYDTIDGFVMGKRRGNFGDRVDPKRAKTDDQGDEEMEVLEESVDAMGMTDFTIGDAESSIPKAKPSEQPTHISGSSLEVPTLPGLLFPYFPDMMDSDFNFVSGVVKEYFLECLGDTRDEILGNYRDFKGSMGSIASTETGRVLQHLFLGISLAVRAQGRLFPIMDQRRYLGFTLHGWYFTVSIDGYKHRPVDTAELAKQVRRVDEHAVALAEILQRLQKLKLKDTNRVPSKMFLQTAKEDALRNPRALANLVRSFKLEENEIIEEIEKMATRLSFPQRYWPFTVENILRAIDLLVSDSFPPIDVPMFARGGTITAEKPAISIFAAFGECGFSFKTPGGRPLKVPSEISGDTVLKPYKGKNQKEVKPNPTFIMSKKSLALCVDDWKAFLGDHVFLNKETRDAVFRAIKFGGPPGATFWKGLIERVGPLAIDAGVVVHGDEIDLGEDELSEGDDNLDDFL